MKNINAGNVDGYIGSFPEDVQVILKKMRAVIKRNAPDAEEKISYGIPFYELNGRLVYFAAQKSHIGFYALPNAIKKFRRELKGYKTSIGTIQFPYDKPLPVDLIEKIVKFRVEENLKK